jgi:hypothetical protein
LAVVPVVSLRVAVADGEAKICGLFNGQRYEISANGQPDRLSHSTEHLNQGIDRELGRFLVHDIGHAWPRHHQDLRRIPVIARNEAIHGLPRFCHCEERSGVAAAMTLVPSSRGIRPCRLSARLCRRVGMDGFSTFNNIV